MPVENITEIVGANLGQVVKLRLQPHRLSRVDQVCRPRVPCQLLATSKSGTHWEPRDQGLDGGLVSSLRALL